MGWAPRISVPAVILSERETRGIQLVGINPSAESISFLDKVAIDCLLYTSDAADE